MTQNDYLSVYLNHMLLKPGDDYYFDDSEIPVLTLPVHERDILTIERTPSSVEDLQVKMNKNEDILSTSNYIYKENKWMPIKEMEKFMSELTRPTPTENEVRLEVETKESFASQIGKLARHLESIANYLTVTNPRTEERRREIENVQLPHPVFAPNNYERAALDALKLAAHARVRANELFDQYTAWQRASNEYERESAAWLDTSATFRRLKRSPVSNEGLSQEEWLRQSKPKSVEELRRDLGITKEDS